MNHYTISMWENKENMKSFYTSGAHLEAMKQTNKIASKVITYSFESDDFPSWKQAKTILKEKGKITHI